MRESMTILPEHTTVKCLVCDKEFKKEPESKRLTCSDSCKGLYNETIKEKRLKESIYIIPPKFRDTELTQNKIELIRKHKNKSCFITGGAGVGKTVLMAGMIKEYIRDGVPVKWISYTEFIMTLQDLYKKEQAAEELTSVEQAKETANFSGILAIDDIGAEKLTEYVRQVTYYIINQREQFLLTTLITSNFNLHQIDMQIDVRVSSRIAGMCDIIKLQGEDKRIKKEN